MINLDVIFVHKGHLDDVAWDSEPGLALRYRHFLGDVRFSIGEVDFSTDWGWVPVWDFALAINDVVQVLAPGAAKDLEFSESEATIRFTRRGDDVRVTSSYNPEFAHVDFYEFRAAARDLVQKLGRRLEEDYPGLAQNADFLDARRKARLS